MEKINIYGQEYPLVIKENIRSKRILFRFYDNALYATVPVKTSLKCVIDTAKKVETSIYKMIIKNQNRVMKFEQFKNIHFFGDTYLVIYSNKNKIDGNIMYLNAEDPRSGYFALAKKYALDILRPRVNYYMNKICPNIVLKELKIRNMASIYGDCYHRLRIITLNARLAYFTLEQIDSVIIHEIVHLLHPDHSDKFYKEVLKHCPNYYQIVKEMNEVSLR